MSKILLAIRRFVIAVSLLFIVLSLVAIGTLKYLPPPTTAFMLVRHLEEFEQGKTFRPIKYQWINRSHISNHARQAVIASEDQRFYSHRGFDTEAISQALTHYQKGGKLRGASTISQQVAKNLFLTPARNMGRKALEFWFTALIELVWDKQRILEVYLNIAEFGDHLFGIGAASRYYFGVSADQLTPKHAALLAAILPSPRRYSPINPSPYLIKRQTWILKQMHNLRH
ncbi:monofunctional biosynthetic peptidoglycan transglycosylase [Methylicorpusculum sp.]|uniref:monofunctional biosynthetic peptidoglycan transglycosylase n=1 Tax=Methylicorpusculum sp. TaxID=2713644 RepID=UPI00272FCC4B|nr:monofunctional biosynthetic peptidoglycan transglycosylase [Methylicorpusculum sp.]MDP2178786.1 monofunctional biosynthetic peptidoglycan transglycosylase [Methylicorpusculum sp.]MDP3530369.1 monofunctional biosynthetic peptidoglycan transglycosylase [Methylicorpusculum sp.]MDZ4153910.1 monofunctional biosynthetic peptidoglycan transglycosylase [Methylicorpusculum sp.]